MMHDSGPATQMHCSLPLAGVVESAAVAVYLVTGLPPLEISCQLTSAARLPRVPVTCVGESGIVAGVTGLDGDDASPIPATLDAVTVKV